MLLSAVPFVELLKRSTKSKFDTIVMVNRIIMQCYNIDIDSDVGMNYLLYVPNTEEYSSSFYDELLVLEPRAIIDIYAAGHKILLEEKKKQAAKPKEVHEELSFDCESPNATLKFLFYVKDELITTTSISIPYPVNTADFMIDNCVSTFTNMIDRIKPGGQGIVLDGIRLGFMSIAENNVQVHYYTVKLNNNVVRIPIIRSMFLGAKTYDQIIVSIQETLLKNIYLFSYQLSRKGISEQFFGYIQNF